MRLKILRNILKVTLLTLASLELVSSFFTIDATTAAKAQRSSKIASSLTDVSSKASKFSKVLNSGLSTFSTYVYGVTATMAVVNLLWPGTFPESEPAYVAEMRAYFEVLKQEFRVVKNQINDLQLYVQKRSTEAIYSNYIISIHSTELAYQDYMDSNEALREGYAKSFIQNYDQLGNHADKLYTGLTITDDNLNIAKNAISYTKGDRSKVLEIMFELFNVINMGIKHEALYYHLTNDTQQIAVLDHRWGSRMNNLQKVMKQIDDEVVRRSKDQMKTDFHENVVELKDKDNNKMAQNLYNFFSEKYYWKDWIVIVYASGVKGFSNHAYRYCSGTVFESRYGHGVDKTIFLFNINKASGSWMTKSQASGILGTGQYTYTGTCTRPRGRGYERYDCQKPITNLRIPREAVKVPLKMCSITKGIVMIKTSKGFGVAGDDRIKVQLRKSEFTAFAIGPYGSSSRQESVEGYSINGGWTSWTAWTKCSKTCESGVQTRTRFCRNPLPQDGGRYCYGRSTQSQACNTFDCFSKEFLTKRIESIMASQRKLSNDDFVKYLRNDLQKTYSKHRFSVNVYNAVSGHSQHTMQGHSYTKIFRKYGRNVVVGYTKRSNSVPSSSKLKEIEKRIVAAIYKKGKEAYKSREKAWEALKKEGYRVALVLVVRHGNGLRSWSTGGGVFFENFNSSGGHKSSIVVMLGKA